MKRAGNVGSPCSALAQRSVGIRQVSASDGNWCDGEKVCRVGRDLVCRGTLRSRF